MTAQPKALNRTVNSSVQLTRRAIWRHTEVAGSGLVSAVASRLTPIRCGVTALLVSNVVVRGNRMKALAELVFVSEIVMQTKIAAQAAERLSSSLDRLDQIEVWSSIQSILIAAGSVSKILWPPRSSSKGRGTRLRELLRVDDSNPLSDRNFRNHFEHYDERIEDWFKEAASAAYMDSRIDPFESPLFPGPSCHHRAYNPVTMALTFRGESMDLAAILEALNEIRQECRFHALP